MTCHQGWMWLAVTNLALMTSQVGEWHGHFKTEFNGLSHSHMVACHGTFKTRVLFFRIFLALIFLQKLICMPSPGEPALMTTFSSSGPTFITTPMIGRLRTRPGWGVGQRSMSLQAVNQNKNNIRTLKAPRWYFKTHGHTYITDQLLGRAPACQSTPEPGSWAGSGRRWRRGGGW